jgi:hypothetical protein
MVVSRGAAGRPRFTRDPDEDVTGSVWRGLAAIDSVDAHDPATGVEPVDRVDPGAIR